MNSGGPLGGPTNAHHKKMSQCLYGCRSWGPQVTIDQERRTFPALCHTSVPPSDPKKPEAAVLRKGKQRTHSEGAKPAPSPDRAELGTGRGLQLGEKVKLRLH